MCDQDYQKEVAGVFGVIQAQLEQNDTPATVITAFRKVSKFLLSGPLLDPLEPLNPDNVWRVKQYITQRFNITDIKIESVLNEDQSPLLRVLQCVLVQMSDMSLQEITQALQSCKKTVATIKIMFSEIRRNYFGSFPITEEKEELLISKVLLALIVFSNTSGYGSINQMDRISVPAVWENRKDQEDYGTKVPESTGSTTLETNNEEVFMKFIVFIVALIMILIQYGAN